MSGDGGGDLSSASKGTTVFISSNLNNKDYSSIGAPNSTVGTYFVLTQYITLSDLDNDTTFNINLGAPVATVLENTIGNIWFTYSNTGDYVVNSDLIINDKTFSIIGTGFENIANNNVTGLVYASPGQLSLQTGVISMGHVVLANDILLNTPIEIRVYN
jgi:hypothetical protein